MTYTILYAKTDVRDIKKLDPIVKKRLKTKIEQYLKDPTEYAKPLTGGAIGNYRWRIGNYRLLFDIDGKTIVILRVRHRRESYR